MGRRRRDSLGIEYVGGLKEESTATVRTVQKALDRYPLHPLTD